VHFTGRGKELEFLEKALSTNHPGVPSRCAVHGMPGIGKTHLILRYAKLSFDQNRYTFVFWISATSVDKINQGISGILDLIGHRDRHLQDQTAKVTAARLWLEQSNSDEDGNWLLVFDNVHIDSLGFLRSHLPLRNERGSILFTTRTKDVAEA
jgi:GTPase SAR1 family protein